MADEKASVATIFAFSLLTLLAASGVAIDYAAAHDRKSKFDSAADSGVLAAVKAAKDAFLDGKNWEEAAQNAGASTFTQNAAKAIGAKVTGVSVSVTRVGNEFRGSLTYGALYPTSLMKLFQKSEIAITNTITASFAIANYLDVHLMIDVSPSMGIGATLADQTLMQATNNCALACHQQAGHLEAVRAAGARTRIDIVRDAVRTFIDDLKTRRSSSDQVRLSINLFSNQIMPLFAASTDLDAAYAAAANIDLATYPAFGTNMTHSLGQLNAAIPPGGAGFRDTNRKSYVVMLSDGIEDSRYRQAEADPESADPNFTGTSPFYVAYFERLQSMERQSCDAIKAANHTMMTAHVEYLVPPAWDAAAVPRFDFIKDHLIAKSIDEFAACASQPDHAFTASESADIEPMFGKILDAIMTPSDLRLTN